MPLPRVVGYGFGFQVKFDLLKTVTLTTTKPEVVCLLIPLLIDKGDNAVAANDISAICC